MDRLSCPHGGALLLSSFPGSGLVRDGASPRGAVEAGLAAFAAAGASSVVTLVEETTLDAFGCPDLGALARRAGLAWLHLPIADFSTPGDDFVRSWRDAGPGLHARLDRGETVAVHCRAGLGRTGTVAAMILIERGLEPADAVARVRSARPGTIETDAQRAWVEACRNRRR